VVRQITDDYEEQLERYEEK